ncbi:acyl carrier protein [Maribacter algarum]|uniref:Acyl carrier protein n=1 Tax=Maribacter algarum (ex Zhang et al. 2020) TaxID=2578118 RepID=A0A5S3PHM8_9FLAO|nr:acyl carrier protein [Maribacter algarum]TMM53768.1 acyl carrier protein [Maribacter algarum]
MNEKIIAFIKNEITTEPLLEIDSEDNLLENGIVDSMGMMRLILFLEKQFKKRVPTEDMTLENFKTVEKIALYFSA